MRYIWIAIGWTCVGLGIAGAFLPLLPTTPFLLLAAFAFSRGSSQLHDWLLNHPHLGPPIQHWQAHGAVSTRVKVIASISLVVVFALSVIAQAPVWLLFTQGFILCGVAIFLWTRRTPPEQG
jgi:uncharacterized membrane protein YbaN (DUF454 family)